MLVNKKGHQHCFCCSKPSQPLNSWLVPSEIIVVVIVVVLGSLVVIVVVTQIYMS